MGPRALLAGDGGLLTAGLVGIVLGLDSLGAGMPAVVGFAAVLLGPLLAWYLHGRHVDGTAALGAVLGFIAGLVVLIAVLALAGILGLTQGNIPGAVWVEVVVVLAVYLAASVWLDVDALRDLSPQRRTHVRLDIVRLLATAGCVAFIVGEIVWATGSLSPDVDQVPVLLVLVGPGALGAAAAMGADLMVRRHEQRSQAHPPLISGA